MKKLFVVFLLMMIGVVAHGEGLVYYQDSSATDTLRLIPVSDLTPLPINGVITIGNVTVDAGAPPLENFHTALALTSTPVNVTSLANRKSVNIFNHSATATAWVSFDASVASAAVGVSGTSVPIFPYGMVGTDLDSVKTISLVTATSCEVTVYQDGY
jgi:hypothetical protein